MNWIKDIYLDLVVLLVVILYSFYYNEVLLIVLWVYTSLLLVGKIISLFMPSLRRRAGNTSIPNSVYHGIYLVTVVVLFYAADYYLAGIWLLIWIISTIADLKSSSKRQN